MPEYNNLVLDPDFRRELAAYNTPELQLAIQAIEEDMVRPSDRSYADINTVALRFQFEAGAKIALDKLRTLLTPKTEPVEVPVPVLKSWGGLIDEDPMQ